MAFICFYVFACEHECMSLCERVPTSLLFNWFFFFFFTGSPLKFLGKHIFVQWAKTTKLWYAKIWTKFAPCSVSSEKYKDNFSWHYYVLYGKGSSVQFFWNKTSVSIDFGSWSPCLSKPMVLTIMYSIKSSRTKMFSLISPSLPVIANTYSLFCSDCWCLRRTVNCTLRKRRHLVCHAWEFSTITFIFLTASAQGISLLSPASTLFWIKWIPFWSICNALLSLFLSPV